MVIPVRIRLQEVESARKTRPPGYVDALYTAGQSNGAWLILDVTAWNRIQREHFGEAGRFLPEPLPSIPQQAANAGKAILRTGMRLIQGGDVFVPDSVAAERQAKCQPCEHFLFTTGRCSKCGCFVAGKVALKAKLAAERCPVGKWEAWAPNSNMQDQSDGSPAAPLQPSK
jgi:hypothetical protein